MPLRWRSRRRFDGITAGKRSLAGQFLSLDSAAGFGDNLIRAARLGHVDPR